MADSPMRIPFDPKLGIESVSIHEPPAPVLAPRVTPTPSPVPVRSQLEALFGGYRLGREVYDSLAPTAARLQPLAGRSYVVRDHIQDLAGRFEDAGSKETAAYLQEDYANHELLAVLRRALLGG